jgi:hypothetical protein
MVNFRHRDAEYSREGLFRRVLGRSRGTSHRSEAALERSRTVHIFSYHFKWLNVIPEDLPEPFRAVADRAFSQDWPLFYRP